MAKKSIEVRKNKVADISTDLKNREKQVSEIEDTYSKAFDLRIQMENSNLDDELLEEARKESEKRLNDLKADGEKLSEEMNDETKRLEEVREENNDSFDETNTKKKDAEKFDSLTNGAVSEKFDQALSDIKNISNEINDAQKKLDELVRRAGNISKGRSSF
ncbi:hypothetical protein [Ruminococcus callidus]|uniref:hypothetical protein n=1 Tax=Ruminococcus callidus TaxID=40519 RepID=UPI0035201576